MKNIISTILILCSILTFGQDKSLEKAVNHHNGAKYEKAIIMYTKVLENDSTNQKALFGRGICYGETKQLDKSLTDFLNFDMLYPNHPLALKTISMIYSEKRNFIKAANYLELSIENGLEADSRDLYDLGSCYYFSGNNEKAIKYLTKSYELDSTFAPTWNNLAWANLDNNPYSSCKYFKKAFNLDSLDFRNINNLGYSHLLCGDMEVAYKYFQRAEVLNPENSFVYRNYGLYYMRMGNKEKACKNLKKSIELKIIEEWGVHYITELQEYCK